MHGRKRDRLDENRCLVRKLYQIGYTDRDISLEIGATRSAVGYWRKRNKLPRNSRKGRTYATWHHRATLLVSKGWTIAAVAEHVGQQLDTVERTLRRMKSRDPHP